MSEKNVTDLSSGELPELARTLVATPAASEDVRERVKGAWATVAQGAAGESEEYWRVVAMRDRIAAARRGEGGGE